jgi:hypothetical protein
VSSTSIYADASFLCFRNGPRIVSERKVLTFHAYKPDFAWVGREVGYCYACFKTDEFGLLDKDLSLESVDGDLIDLLNMPQGKKKKEKKKTDCVDNRGNKWKF